MSKLELRMYGLVPYNISPIQQGIQFGHAVVEYGQEFKNKSLYNEWADDHKTFIILNGGTTNNTVDKNGLPFGTLNNHLIELEENGIEVSTFSEPDLGDQLTSVVFIVDERVFNKKKYPDFKDWLVSNYIDYLSLKKSDDINEISNSIKNSDYSQDQKVYKEWLSLIGGEKNAFLKEFLSNFRLA